MDTADARHGAPGGTGRAAADVTDGLVVTGGLTIPQSAMRWRFSRSGGPGGQGVNTTDSRVELVVLLGRVDGLTDAQRARIRTALAHRIAGDVLTVSASEHRSQLRNRQSARERAAALLRGALAAPPPRSRRRRTPSRAAQQRRLDAKKRRGQTKALRRRPDY